MNRSGIENALSKLRAREDFSPLVPAGPRDKALNKEIEALIPESASDAERAVKSALHLWNDSLTRSHELSQEIKSTTGSYLHGVRHRREPDYGNSKYWFHRVGVHAAFPDVRATALELLGKASSPSKELMSIRDAIEESAEWDGFRMIDWCEASDGGRMPADVTSFLEALQLREIAAITEYCLAQAKG